MKDRVLIVGSGRCGTTILHKILSAIPGFYCPPEVHYFDHVLLKRLTVINDYIIFNKNFSNWKKYVLDNHILKVLQNEKPSTRKEAINYFIKLMDHNAKLSNKKIWLEKTPAHLFFIKQIEKYTDKICYIHVIRDPKSTIASLVKVGRKYPKDWKGYSSVKKSYNYVKKALEESNKHIGKSNHYFFVYERFIKNPRSEIFRLLNWMNLNITKKNLDHIISKGMNKEILYKGEDWKKNYGSKISVDRNQQFISILNKFQIQYVTKYIDYTDKLYDAICNSISD